MRGFVRRRPPSNARFVVVVLLLLLLYTLPIVECSATTTAPPTSPSTKTKAPMANSNATPPTSLSPSGVLGIAIGMSLCFIVTPYIIGIAYYCHLKRRRAPDKHAVESMAVAAKKAAVEMTSYAQVGGWGASPQAAAMAVGIANNGDSVNSQYSPVDAYGNLSLNAEAAGEYAAAQAQNAYGSTYSAVNGGGQQYIAAGGSNYGVTNYGKAALKADKKAEKEREKEKKKMEKVEKKKTKGGSKRASAQNVTRRGDHRRSSSSHRSKGNSLRSSAVYGATHVDASQYQQNWVVGANEQQQYYAPNASAMAMADPYASAAYANNPAAVANPYAATHSQYNV